MNNKSLENFYKTELSAFNIFRIETNYMDVVLLLFFLGGVIIILYTRLFLGIEFENWEIQKCNPKYIFYSGYIKQNPDSSSFHSTVDNFNECIVKFNNQKNNKFSQVLQQNKAEHMYRTNETVNTYNKLSREKILQLQKKVNSKNNEFKLQIENVKESRETSDLQNELNKLNVIMSDIQEYAHSYLTYAMMNFVFKYNISTKDGTSNKDLNNAEQCNKNDETSCNSNIYCTFDNNNCRKIKKGEFYKQEALKINETIKKYFGNNKL